MSHTVNAMSRRSIQRFAKKGISPPYIMDASGEDIPALTVYYVTYDAGSGIGVTTIRDAIYG